MDVNMKLKLLSEERDGPILRCLYACPCGQGTVEEEQDYTEGHRDCWASLKCSICRNNYKVIFSDSGLSWDIVKNDSVQIEKTKEIIQNRNLARSGSNSFAIIVRTPFACNPKSPIPDEQNKLIAFFITVPPPHL